MAAGWSSRSPVRFPPSDTSLWDGSAKGPTVKVNLTSSGWLLVKINSSTLKLALRHSSYRNEAFLMATPIVNKDGRVTLEVNRYDIGKSKDGGSLTPTTILPGDVAIHCKIICEKGDDDMSVDGYTTHNLGTLQESFTSIKSLLTSSYDEVYFHSLMSIRVVIIHNKYGIKVNCGCVLPDNGLIATPILPLPLLSVSLTRNLTGTFALPHIQNRIRTGYLTMNETRKLVPLLPNDTQVSCLPLIGIWLGGVTSISHPSVWSSCLHYMFSSLLWEKVYQDGMFLVLIIDDGCGQPRLYQCQTEDDNWAWHVGCTEYFQLNDEDINICLTPVIGLMACHTLLTTAISTWLFHDDSHPLPLPPISPSNLPCHLSCDSDLSINVTNISRTSDDKSIIGGGQFASKIDVGTNTGSSLCIPVSNTGSTSFTGIDNTSHTDVTASTVGSTNFATGGISLPTTSTVGSTNFATGGINLATTSTVDGTDVSITSSIITQPPQFLTVSSSSCRSISTVTDVGNLSDISTRYSTHDDSANEEEFYHNCKSILDEILNVKGQTQTNSFLETRNSWPHIHSEYLHTHSSIPNQTHSHISIPDRTHSHTSVPDRTHSHTSVPDRTHSHTDWIHTHPSDVSFLPISKIRYANDIHEDTVMSFNPNHDSHQNTIDAITQRYIGHAKSRDHTLYSSLEFSIDTKSYLTRNNLL